VLDVALEVGVLVDSVVVITTMPELVVRLVLVKLDGKLGGLFV
jgi:hypothetical protein